MSFIRNESGNDNAIEGISKGGRGIVGRSETNYGIRASSIKISGIRSSSEQGPGVEGESNTYHGVVGGSKGAGVGVWGASHSGIGVFGESKKNEGVRGVSRSGAAGVVGINESIDPKLEPPPRRGDIQPATSGANGGWFESTHGEGVRGWSKNRYHGGVVGINTAGGSGVYGESDANGVAVHGKGGRLAGKFEGHVEVTGDIRFTNAADCAEDFDIANGDSAEPGTVMVLGGDESLHRSCYAYDKSVAGVVSGAGEYKPGIVLDKQGTNSNRKPIALLGKVYCKVDAQYASIEVGDLLTTSPSPGHAMKASDRSKAFGAVIGKALRQLKEGQGLIPILITLQ
jgi:hypothetical protein